MKAYFEEIKDIYASCKVKLSFKGVSASSNTKEGAIELLKEAISFDLWNNNRNPEPVTTKWDGESDEVEVIFKNPNTIVYLGG